MFMQKKKYIDIVRENFVCQKINDPVNKAACNALINCFQEFNIVSFYKFMSLTSKYAISNIENEVFHFSRKDKLNDPFEFANEIDVTSERARREELLKCCVFIEQPTATELEEFLNPSSAWEVMNEIKEYTFIYSLTTSYDNPPMWSGYAGDYNGVCVEYDAWELFKRYNWMLSPIEYVERVPSAEYDMDLDSILKFIHQSFTTKGIKWRDEDEWRIIRIAYADKLTTLNETMPLKSITLGNKISEADRRRLVRICKRKGIPLYEIVVKQGTYNLSRKLIDTNEVKINGNNRKKTIWSKLLVF